MKPRVRLDPEERRGALIAAALRVLAKRPSRALTPEDVTKEADVSRALFYRYFSSMEHLELAALRNVVERLPFVPPDDAPLREQVARALHSFFDFASMLKGPTLALLGPTARASAKANALLEGGRSRIVEVMCSRAGVEDPSALARLTLRSWLGFVERTVVSWLEAGERMPPRAELEAWLVEVLEAMIEPVTRRERLTVPWDRPPAPMPLPSARRAAAPRRASTRRSR